MENDFFKYFCTETEGFVFSIQQSTIPAGISGTSHEREVKALFTDVRRMAVKKSLQLPESFSADCDREDWIQLAMVTMFQCCEKYDRKRPFDYYVRFMVSKKLADKHRSLLRKNPPADRDILYLYNEMKKIQGDEAAIITLAETTNRSVEQLRELVDAGVGPRMFISEVSDAMPLQETEFNKPTLTPEDEAEKKEMTSILQACINKLSEKSKSLFLRHEIDEVSFKTIFIEACYKRSFASFKRWYKADIFERVQQCVLSQVLSSALSEKG